MRLLLRCQIHNRCIMLGKIKKQTSDLCTETTGELVPVWGQATCGTVKLVFGCLVSDIMGSFQYAIYDCCCVLHVLFIRLFCSFHHTPICMNQCALLTNKQMKLQSHCSWLRHITNSPCSKKLKGGYIVFQGHRSNFKVTRDKKSLNLTRI